ncbi:hypothetical protein BAUCODRAFT_281935 [Baudoinia panamericana UAMH 10762]|uniref:Sulfotransferase domain-containing protein n=1 Tax=Baudoinia panamericana (strain UAMH 10762) TaxID=717646 RepID=M2MLE4_BAUPA|nr:uncharacterized protein BAUCODRAFT_281935 [Baudoinia panamericana UAMH 10762]EMC92208.1 hypothetical protein BAUCODRAFT_281935 [Baudoinia panamericana UAMH 10762]
MATAADFKRIGNYARMYNKDLNFDRRNERRTVPFEVVCPGYSRTGTLTMHKALSILGYPTFHFSSFYENSRDCLLWTEAVKAKFYGQGPMPDKAFFDGLLGHISATTDSPCNLFTEEFITFYPDVKVVLVERNIDSWEKSWTAYCKGALNPVLHFICNLDPTWAGRIAVVGAYITRIQAGYATTLDEVRVRSRVAYQHHYRDVRDIVPKERLLDFDLRDGWKPLCEFLGKPVPDVPFPHENETKANQAALAETGQLALKHIMRNLAIGLTLVGVPVAAAIWWLLQR